MYDLIILCGADHDNFQLFLKESGPSVNRVLGDHDLKMITYKFGDIDNSWFEFPEDIIPKNNASYFAHDRCVSTYYIIIMIVVQSHTQFAWCC